MGEDTRPLSRAGRRMPQSANRGLRGDLVEVGERLADEIVPALRPRLDVDREPLAHRALAHDHALRRAVRDELARAGFGHLHDEPAEVADEREDLSADAEALAAEHGSDVDARLLEVTLRDRVEDRVSTLEGGGILGHR